VRGVKSSRGLKFLIILLFLSLTLAWKVIARATPHQQPTDRNIQVRLAEFLTRQHFSVSMMERAEEGKPAITASSGSCRMIVMRSPALGWDRDLVRRYADAEDQVFVVYRGRIYSDQPTFRTVVDTLWSRFQRELGFPAWPSPVFAVVARLGCEADRLPWDQFDPARS
jgi:ribosomal protein S18 acetylase RimI-like enzyme